MKGDNSMQFRGLICGLIVGFLLSSWLIRPNTHLTMISNVIDDALFQNSVNGNVSEVLEKEVKILCWIMTNPKNENKWKHIRNMWGKKCSKLIFMSSKTYYHTENIEVVGVSVGEDNRESLWAKTKESFVYAYRNYYNDYDWFIKADDDTYVIMENLRYLLHHYDANKSLYLGHRYLINTIPRGYMAGMAYILSKGALKTFHDLLMENKCRVDGRGAEDAEMGICLADHSIQVDTRDEHFGHRFFPVSPNDAMDPFGVQYWYQKNQYYKLKIGPDCCSDTPVAFHYISIPHMYLLNYLFYQVQPFGISRSVSEDILPKKLTTEEILKRSIGLKS